ncbi:hypothetical protein M6I34_05085 [Burkholderiaceae bacterium FT117]|uniref:hypothetical protein n=1 Tax=Zeimonas sediminis TaxID=2944268 RepID=UPI002342ED7A|nr:hypothetical protein [Zeimonas sediminis]MCM5569873.1 hypothetical protein [Zeimonas sediminis]
MSLEDIWYESSPYVYLIAGILVLASAESGLAIASALLLLVASGTILRLRWVHRRGRAAARTKAGRARAARPGSAR